LITSTIREFTRSNTNQIWCGFGFRVDSCDARGSFIPSETSPQEMLHFRFLLFPLLFLFLTSPPVLAALSEKQARKLISLMAGAELPSGAVRVKRITESNGAAEATAEIETAFRLVQDEQRHWHVAEVRTGQDRWEEISLIAGALKRQEPEGQCTAPDLAKAADGVVSVKRARCLIAGLLGIQLPSDAVRIRGVSSLGLPFASSSSALVVALVEVDVRFREDRGNWRISELRIGRGDWFSIEATFAAVNEEKKERAQKELATLAGALDAFRRDTGFYVASDKHPVLIDHLSPHYLSNIIRLDPWHNPYRYDGERDRFQLRSDGPDGEENTPDDLVVTAVPRANGPQSLN
jgi:hypothetical protein